MLLYRADKGNEDGSRLRGTWKNVRMVNGESKKEIIIMTDFFVKFSSGGEAVFSRVIQDSHFVD